MKKLKIPPLISISIDLAGSTDAKRRFLEIGPKNLKLRHQHYEGLAKEILFAEDRFYSELFSPDTSSTPPLDIQNFFVVKNIGDEIWMLYQLPDLDPGLLLTSMSRILDAAYAMVNSGSEYVATSQLSTPNFDPNGPIPRTVVRIPTEFKVYVDLITDYINVSSVREKYLLPRIGRYGAGANPTAVFVDLTDEKNKDIIQRLNIGYFAGKTFVKRGDIIGYEVDLFFRTSKAAQAGIVTVGDQLFQHIGLNPDKPEKGIQRGAVMVPMNPKDPKRNVRRGTTTFWRQKVLPESQLKGIGKSYTVWHLASELVVRYLHTLPERTGVAKAKRIFPRTLVHKTRVPKLTAVVPPARSRPRGTK